MSEKEKLLALCGNMDQMAGVTLGQFRSGAAKDMDVLDMNNGILRLQVLPDHCLDAGMLSYNGTNVSFLAKTGFQNPSIWDIQGQDAAPSINCGFLFTGGFENIGAANCSEGRRYPLHGTLRTRPAEHVNIEEEWKNDQYHLGVSGTVRQAELAGGNLLLRRSWSMVMGESTLILEDEVENQGFAAEPMMLLYHFNIGYPLLSPGAEVILPSLQVTPRNDNAKKGLDRWSLYSEPVAQKEEEVFIHKLAADEQGQTFAAIYNPECELGLCLTFDQKAMPCFYQWKMEASGDYVLGLEPSNTHIDGRSVHLKEEGKLPTIEPMKVFRHRIECNIFEGQEAYEKVKKRRDALLSSK